MIYDLVMIAVLLITIALGAYRGLAWQLASLASIVVGYSAALRFAGDVALLIDIEPPWNWVVAMAAVFAAGSLAVWLVFRLVSGFIDRLKLKEFDKQMGGLVGAAKGVLLCLAITFFAVTLHERSRELVLESKSGWYMALLIDRADPMLPENLHAVLGPYLHQLEKELDARGDPNRPAEDYHGQDGVPAVIPTK
ncbi:MAG: CvpA family protein [Planctomycetes bacterium]|nr:CvpA family protein [Planctomycetota bacterium]